MSTLIPTATEALVMFTAAAIAVCGGLVGGAVYRWRSTSWHWPRRPRRGA